MKPYSLKEIWQGARGMITRKMLATVLVPMLLLAVAIGFLSLFRFSLSDKISAERDALMLEAAQQAFPNAIVERIPHVYENGAENSDFDFFVYTAFENNIWVGYCLVEPVGQRFEGQSFAIVAVDSGGNIFYEKAYAPSGPDSERALESARRNAPLRSPVDTSLPPGMR